VRVRVTAPVRIDISGGWPDSDPYRADFGGIVLNAAINIRVSANLDRDLVVSSGPVPPRSGLGASGALRSVELVASNPRLIKNKTALIDKVHSFENKIIGNRAGFQDEAASIYGGVNYWEFGRHDQIRRKAISRKRAQHLEDRLVLIYTGETHLSANIHDLVFGPSNYTRNIPTITRMKEIATEMKDKLTEESEMARLIGETWALQRSLHPSIESRRMRILQRLLKGDYLAARATGAGGGGCMIFYTNDRANLVKTLGETRKKLSGTRVIPFKFDYVGIECRFL
jgi:galactokinase/mevalonate kinase-like predicted kinase